MGSMPLGFGLVILSGSFFPKTMRKLHWFVPMLVSSRGIPPWMFFEITNIWSFFTVFWTFLSARLLSTALDGLPSPKIVEGMGYEFLLGCLNAIALWKFLAAQEKGKTA
jgi:hypothetical protein